MIRKLTIVERCKDWNKYLDEIRFAILTSLSEATGFSAAYLNLGRELKFPLDVQTEAMLDEIAESEDVGMALAQNRDFAMDNFHDSIHRSISYFGRDRQPHNFKVEDVVLVK